MRGRGWVAACLGCFAVIAGVLFALRAHAALALSRAAAIADATHARVIIRALRGAGRWTAQVVALDHRTVLVSFSSHGRLVAEAMLQPHGQLRQAIDFPAMRVPYGDWIAYRPAALLGAALVFAAAAGVLPLRRVRNLDVLAALVLLGSVVLFAQRYVAASLAVAATALIYLLVRCLVRGLTDGGEEVEQIPLLLGLARRWPAATRVRLLRVILAAVAAIYLMVAVSSPDAVDVTYAVMEGATTILHGLLPYGHLPGDVFHGDTYPILSYLLYVPLAALSPVRSVWGSVDSALAAAALAAVLAAWGVARSLGAGRTRARIAPAEEERSLCAALALLAFPSLLITTSTGTSDVLLGCLVALALLWWRRPAASMALVAVAGWFKLVPFVLVPLWLAPLRGRRLLAASAALAALTGAVLAAVVAIGGLSGLAAMLHGVSYQLSRGENQSLPAALGLTGLQPLLEAGAATIALAGAAVLRSRPARAADPRRVASLAAATLIAAQLAANYWAFLYLSWIAPLLVLALFSARPRIAPGLGAPASLPRRSADVGPPALVAAG
jgi:hypothetical protein